MKALFPLLVFDTGWPYLKQILIIFIINVLARQKEAIQAALDAVEFEERDNNSCKTCSGTLELSEVIFYLKADSIDQQTPSKFNEHFVILVTSGKTVLSSKVLVSDKNGEIKSDKKFRVTALQTDFEVSVAVYSMKVEKHANDAKNHKKVSCFRSSIRIYANFFYI